ncbi:17298_t:CDS:2 [Funneliformis geosporum]|nr:17298_t:CDS:2 [Funneliformis geosporum]
MAYDIVNFMENHLDDKYNVDETGLLFCITSNKTLAQEPINETKK